MSLQDLLDQTIDDPMPPGFDVDRVIANARRAERRRNVFAGAGAAVLMAVAGSATWFLSTGSADPPPATVTERVDAAVLALIEREAPELRWLPGPGPAQSWHSEWEPGSGEYHGRGTIQVGDRVGQVTLSLRRYAPAEFPRTLTCLEVPPQDDCAVHYHGDFPPNDPIEMHIVVEHRDPATGLNEIRKTAYRTDMVLIELVVDNRGGAGAITGREPPLTPDDVEDIVLDSSLTLPS